MKIDIEISRELNDCQDNLDNTIDYDALCQKITGFVEERVFSLIETVAEKIAEIIKDSFQVKKLSVSVSKPNAVKNADNIKVTIHR